ncbi:MAG: DUF3789 domain-containing protein [Clostridia bacterium]|nr:DUF3789 domain-containing protein [Clostridia bacterium]
MIQFITGTMFGGLIGIVAMCLCTAAGGSDKRTGLK